MKIFFFELVFAILLLLTGCEKEVILEITESKVMLVANSIFTSDSIVDLFLYKSNSGEPVQDAIIEMYRENEAMGFFKYRDSSLYIYDEIPLKQGMSYNIRIQTPGVYDLIALDTIPYVVPLVDVSFHDSAGIISSSFSSDQYMYSSFEIKFRDPPGDNNYYEIFILREADTTNLILWDSTETDLVLNGISFWELEKQSLFKHNMTLFSFDPSILEEGFSVPERIIPEQDILFFSDELFNGSEKTIRINSWPYYTNLYTTSSFFVPKRKFTIYFRTVSKQYYTFRKTQKIYSELLFQEDIWRGTGDFVQLYSNVENGYGLFAAYSESIDSIIIENSNIP